MGILKYLNRIVLNRSQRVLALSESQAVATAALNVPRSKIEVAPNRVDTSRFRPPIGSEHEPLILRVGSSIECKGVRYLIDTMPQTLHEFPKYQIVIVGEGVQLQSLLEPARTIGVTDHVTITSYQTLVEVSRWLPRANLFVLPLIEECLLEALASGLPCIATRVGGIPDVISEDVGILVPPVDSTAIAEATLALLNDPNRLAALRGNSRQRAVTQYSWDVIALRLLVIYQTVLACKG